MPTYRYSCPRCGEYDADQSIHDPAHTTCVNCYSDDDDGWIGCSMPVKRVVVPVAICIAPQHRAVSYAGREGDKRRHREYRTNKEVAEGLAKGTMIPPDGRGTTGDQQTRESISQFNDMYSKAKSG